jgi:hypothetical protein
MKSFRYGPGLGGDGSGKNGSVGDRSVRNGLVAKKIAADPPFNWFLLFPNLFTQKSVFVYDHPNSIYTHFYYFSSSFQTFPDISRQKFSAQLFHLF